MSDRALVKGIIGVPMFNSETGDSNVLIGVIYLPDDGRSQIEREVTVNMNLLNDSVLQIENKIADAIRALALQPEENMVIEAGDIIAFDLRKA